LKLKIFYHNVLIRFLRQLSLKIRIRGDLKKNIPKKRPIEKYFKIGHGSNPIGERALSPALSQRSIDRLIDLIFSFRNLLLPRVKYRFTSKILAINLEHKFLSFLAMFSRDFRNAFKRILCRFFCNRQRQRYEGVGALARMGLPFAPQTVAIGLADRFAAPNVIVQPTTSAGGGGAGGASRGGHDSSSSGGGNGVSRARPSSQHP
jgi:uncharacterized membrane protein YgcG